MSIWVRLPPTAGLLAFGVIIYISPTCELNVFCSNLLLLCQHFTLCFSIPIMPKFMLAKIDLSLLISVLCGCYKRFPCPVLNLLFLTTSFDTFFFLLSSDSSVGSRSAFRFREAAIYTSPHSISRAQALIVMFIIICIRAYIWSSQCIYANTYRYASVLLIIPANHISWGARLTCQS